MSAVTSPVRVLPFLTQVLEREGAAVEVVGEDALFVVLPNAVGQSLDLPAAGVLELKPMPAAGRHPFPLEGAGMQALVARARSRGRRAGARLANPLRNPMGRLEKARARLVLPNATCLQGEALRPLATRLVMEFGYDAQSEERTEGRVHVAVTESGVPSVLLAERLTAALDGATPESPVLDESAIQSAAALARPRIEEEVRLRLEGFRTDCRKRMDVERERIGAYHDRLAREAQKRVRGGQPGVEAHASKYDAILRQRAERLEDLAERHAISAHYWLASVLVLRYEVGLCRFRIRRRRREVGVDVEWDPFLGDFLGSPCAACGEATFHCHVCDAAGHVTCAGCAARCERCGRVTCRACSPAGCGC